VLATAVGANRMRIGLGAAVRFDYADDDVDARGAEDPRAGQHLPGLADPRRRPEEHF
jgi:hypothetical protein